MMMSQWEVTIEFKDGDGILLLTQEFGVLAESSDEAAITALTIPKPLGATEARVIDVHKGPDVMVAPSHLRAGPRGW